MIGEKDKEISHLNHELSETRHSKMTISTLEEQINSLRHALSEKDA